MTTMFALMVKVVPWVIHFFTGSFEQEHLHLQRVSGRLHRWLRGQEDPKKDSLSDLHQFAHLFKGESQIPASFCFAKSEKQTHWCILRCDYGLSRNWKTSREVHCGLWRATLKSVCTMLLSKLLQKTMRVMFVKLWQSWFFQASVNHEPGT